MGGSVLISQMQKRIFSFCIWQMRTDSRKENILESVLIILERESDNTEP